MSDLVGNPEDRFSKDEAHILPFISVTCDTISNPQNGSVKLAIEGLTTVAKFSCSVGYSVNGYLSSTLMVAGIYEIPNTNLSISLVFHHFALCFSDL